MSTVNINNTDNQVTAVNANQSIIITDNGSTAHTSVTITQPVTSVVLVNTPGPQGPVGGGDFVTTSSFNAFTGSYNTGSFTGSFTGSLLGTASFSTTASYTLNGGGNINTSSFATTGSNTFIGHQFITGSVYVTGSLNAYSQVYEVSFLEKTSPPYPSGDNLIELDQDLITNPNYTRNINVITVNSSGLYKIYTQCRISVTSGLSGDAELAVVINNNPYRTYYIDNIKQTEISTYNFSCVANLNISDTIEFHINSLTQPFMLDTFSKIYTNVTCSYMTIEKLN